MIPERVSCMKAWEIGASLLFLSPNLLDCVVNIFWTKRLERFETESVDGTKEHPADALNLLSL